MVDMLSCVYMCMHTRVFAPLEFTQSADRKPFIYRWNNLKNFYQRLKKKHKNSSSSADLITQRQGIQCLEKLSFVGLICGICKLGNIESSSADAVFISTNYLLEPHIVKHTITSNIYTMWVCVCVHAHVLAHSVQQRCLVIRAPHLCYVWRYQLAPGQWVLCLRTD